MWSTYDFGTLFFPAAVIFIVTVGVALRVTGSLAGSLSAGLIKAGLFLLYFSALFDGSYGLLDDQSYIRGGIELARNGVGLLNITEHLPRMLAMAGGPHFGYYLYNAFAVLLFGYGYFAPVALNATLITLVAALGARLAEREFEFSGQLRVLFFYFFLISPDVLAWSTIINDKDILVLCLHIVLLYGFSLWFRGRFAAAVLLLVTASACLLPLRFYVPLLFSAAFAASAFIGGRGLRRFYWLAVGLVLLGGAAAAVGPNLIALGLNVLREELVNPAIGFIYFLLTPIPLNTDANYAFLDPSAAVHWLLLPFAALGVIMTYRIRTPFTRFFLVYFFTFAALYSIFGELQGPRHRVQVDYAWAVFQFMGLLALVRDARQTAAATARAGEQAE